MYQFRVQARIIYHIFIPQTMYLLIVSVKRYHRNARTGTTIADESEPLYRSNQYQDNHKQLSSVA